MFNFSWIKPINVGNIQEGYPSLALNFVDMRPRKQKNKNKNKTKQKLSGGKRRVSGQQNETILNHIISEQNYQNDKFTAT